MEKTTLISANGYTYERAVPEVRIFGPFNDIALEYLIQRTGINFKKSGNLIVGQPEAWEQLSKIFLTYNFLTHSVNNADGNFIILRPELNVPLTASLYYQQNGMTLLGIQ